MREQTSNNTETVRLPISEISYHELDQNPVQENSSVEQLFRHLDQLEESVSRYQFVMREIQYILKA